MRARMAGCHVGAYSRRSGANMEAELSERGRRQESGTEAHAVLAPAVEGLSPTHKTPEIAEALGLMESLA